MNKLLNLGFFILPISLIVRFFTSHYLNTDYFNIDLFYNWELLFYYLTIAFLIISIWHQFFRIRCPECRSTKYQTLNTEEIDRWLGTKTVKEDLGEGRYREKVINTTYVKIKTSYQCLLCNNQWAIVTKKEK